MRIVAPHMHMHTREVHAPTWSSSGFLGEGAFEASTDASFCRADSWTLFGVGPRWARHDVGAAQVCPLAGSRASARAGTTRARAERQARTRAHTLPSPVLSCMLRPKTLDRRTDGHAALPDARSAGCGDGRTNPSPLPPGRSVRACVHAGASEIGHAQAAGRARRAGCERDSHRAPAPTMLWSAGASDRASAPPCRPSSASATSLVAIAIRRRPAHEPKYQMWSTNFADSRAQL